LFDLESVGTFRHNSVVVPFKRPTACGGPKGGHAGSATNRIADRLKALGFSLKDDFGQGFVAWFSDISFKGGIFDPGPMGGVGVVAVSDVEAGSSIEADDEAAVDAIRIPFADGEAVGTVGLKTALFHEPVTDAEAVEKTTSSIMAGGTFAEYEPVGAATGVKTVTRAFFHEAFFAEKVVAGLEAKPVAIEIPDDDPAGDDPIGIEGQKGAGAAGVGENGVMASVALDSDVFDCGIVDAFGRNDGEECFDSSAVSSEVVVVVGAVCVPDIPFASNERGNRIVEAFGIVVPDMNAFTGFKEVGAIQLNVVMPVAQETGDPGGFHRVFQQDGFRSLPPHGYAGTKVERVPHSEDTFRQNDFAAAEKGGAVHGSLDMVMSEPPDIAPGVSHGHTEVS